MYVSLQGRQSRCTSRGPRPPGSRDPSSWSSRTPGTRSCRTLWTLGNICWSCSSELDVRNSRRSTRTTGDWRPSWRRNRLPQRRRLRAFSSPSSTSNRTTCRTRPSRPTRTGSPPSSSRAERPDTPRSASPARPTPRACGPFWGSRRTGPTGPTGPEPPKPSSDRNCSHFAHTYKADMGRTRPTGWGSLRVYISLFLFLQLFGD